MGKSEAREKGVTPPKSNSEPGLEATSAAHLQCVLGLWRGCQPEVTGIPYFPWPQPSQRADQDSHSLWAPHTPENLLLAQCADLVPCLQVWEVRGRGGWNPTYLIHHQVVVTLVLIAFLGDVGERAHPDQAPASTPPYISSREGVSG